MNAMEQAMSAIRSLGENATLDELIERLHRLRRLEQALAQANAGEGMSHEEFMAQLEAEEAD